MASGYRHLDHTGDVGIEAQAGEEATLFACCARALFEILAGRHPCGVSLERRVEVRAPDREVLMVRWLRELLYIHDTERILFSRFHVETGGGSGSERWLTSRVLGEAYDPSRHTVLTELKAVTYHQISVRRDPDGIWRARVIFDI